MVAAMLDPRGLVFVDECGTHTSLAPVNGYSPKGERMIVSVPRNRGKNTTLLASISLEGMGPSLVVEGSTIAEVFETYLEHVLLPELEEGQVVIMDTLPLHKRGRVRELSKSKGRASAACARPCRWAYSTSMCSMPGISSGHLYPAYHISCCTVVPFFRACLVR
jgi:hypothetical protein